VVAAGSAEQAIGILSELNIPAWQAGEVTAAATPDTPAQATLSGSYAQ